jgi:hypothetical protein
LTFERFIGGAVLVFGLVTTLCVVVAIGTAIPANSALQPWLTGAGVIVAITISVWQQARIDDRENNQRKRKANAARAVLPAALAELCEYAEQCAAKIKGAYPSTAPFTVIAGALPVPKFPTDAMKALRDCIEHSDGREITSAIKLIQRLQIQNTRISAFLLHSALVPLGTHEFDKLSADTILLHAHCSLLFPYARFEDKGKSRTHDQLVRASASSCDIYDYKYPGVFEYINLLPPLETWV